MHVRDQNARYVFIVRVYYTAGLCERTVAIWPAEHGDAVRAGVQFAREEVARRELREKHVLHHVDRYGIGMSVWQNIRTAMSLAQRSNNVAFPNSTLPDNGDLVSDHFRDRYAAGVALMLPVKCSI